MHKLVYQYKRLERETKQQYCSKSFADTKRYEDDKEITIGTFEVKDDVG